VTVEAGDDCLWNATLQSGTRGFNILSGGSNKGNGTVTLSADTAVAGGRSDVLNVVGPMGSLAKTVKLSQGPPSCVDSINGGAAVDLAGKTGAVAVNVKTTDGCKWAASFDPDDKGFSFDGGAEGSGTADLQVKGPAQGAEDWTVKLKIVGPAGADPKSVNVKQPKK
jgi:hypothetical protein